MYLIQLSIAVSYIEFRKNTNVLFDGMSDLAD